LLARKILLLVFLVTVDVTVFEFQLVGLGKLPGDDADKPAGLGIVKVIHPFAGGDLVGELGIEAVRQLQAGGKFPGADIFAERIVDIGNAEIPIITGGKPQPVGRLPFECRMQLVN
jgi:hypothetical protein